MNREVYRTARIFGDRPIQDVFFTPPILASSPERATLQEVCEAFLSKKPSELVAMTHWEKGAWANNYVPGFRAVPIPDSDIAAEYRARTNTSV